MREVRFDVRHFSGRLCVTSAGVSRAFEEISRVFRQTRLTTLEIRIKTLEIRLKTLEIRLKTLDIHLKTLEIRLKTLELRLNTIEIRSKPFNTRLILKRMLRKTTVSHTHELWCESPPIEPNGQTVH